MCCPSDARAAAHTHASSRSHCIAHCTAGAGACDPIRNGSRIPRSGANLRHILAELAVAGRGYDVQYGNFEILFWPFLTQSCALCRATFVELTYMRHLVPMRIGC